MRIGIDTNVLVRYLAGDPDAEKQAAVSVKVLNSNIAKNNKLFINNIVLCETLWVLFYHYKIPKKKLIYFLSHVFEHASFEFENKKLLLNAMKHYQKHSIDFADCLIGQINKQSKCKNTLSFDKKAIQKLGFIEP